MKIRVTLDVKHNVNVRNPITINMGAYSYSSRSLIDAVENNIDDIVLWCMERDIDIALYNVLAMPDHKVDAIFTIEKDDAFMVMMGYNAVWHKQSAVTI